VRSISATRDSSLRASCLNSIGVPTSPPSHTPNAGGLIELADCVSEGSEAGRSHRAGDLFGSGRQVADAATDSSCGQHRRGPVEGDELLGT